MDNLIESSHLERDGARTQPASAVRPRRRRWLSPRLDPLDRTGPDPELCGDLQDTLVALHQGHSDACLCAGIDPGATEGLAVGPRPLEASVDAADNHRPLELSE